MHIYNGECGSNCICIFLARYCYTELRVSWVDTLEWQSDGRKCLGEDIELNAVNAHV